MGDFERQISPVKLKKMQTQFKSNSEMKKFGQYGSLTNKRKSEINNSPKTPNVGKGNIFSAK
jgi:hypothetical protein